jgi:glycosyltransferase involved in cell wall biosynthesis
MTPYNNIGMIRARNRQSVIRSVRSVMAEMGIRKPILVTTLPNAADFVGTFDEEAVIYYCVDDFTQWPGVDGNMVAEMEENLLAQADIVCASSEELCRTRERSKGKPFLLSHGVDFTHVSSAPQQSASLQCHCNRPIVGFFGALSPWLDFELICDLARSRPEWSFVLIGPADVDISRLAALPNLFLPGKIPYDKLPAYAASFDVALIPFLVNDLTVSVNPLKLMEYLACGLPVVSTRLPEVARYGDFVYLADTAVEFGAAISQALAEDSEALREKRRTLARGHSWDAVAEVLSSEIARVIALRFPGK